MKNAFLWLWCFPQMLAGYIVKKVTKARKVDDHYEYDVMLGSLSLGEYRFLCPQHWGREETMKHEYGHTLQSRLLGWLYLPAIAIPSFIWAGFFSGYRKKNNVSYYAFYTEKWADQLAGIKRDE